MWNGKILHERIRPRFGCPDRHDRRSLFREGFDLSHAGILPTIPALSACGLLKHTGRFAGVTGYYTTEQVFIALVFLALALLRVKNLEQSQTIPAGELGRCMGIDRIPEVKTLRERIAAFCREADVAGWSHELSREWMECSEDPDGVLYVDGHARLYYDAQASMPKRFVSRMRL